MIDDLILWNRAMPVAEVADLHEMESQNLDLGLIRFYPLDGNASEELHRQDNGVIHGTEPGPNRFGEQGMALRFDGEDDYAELPSLELGSAYTLSVWVLPHEVKGGGYFAFFPITAIRFGACALRVTCGNTCSGESKVPQCKGTLGRTWFWSGTEISHALYKNGQLDASTEVSAENSVFSVIGAYVPTAGALEDREPFHGMIDDLLVWERALTSSEVSLLYKFESELPEPHGQEGQYPGPYELLSPTMRRAWFRLS